MGYSEGDDEQRSATKEFFKQRERLRRSYESGRPIDRTQAEIDLVEKYFAAGEPKSRRNCHELDGY